MTEAQGSRRDSRFKLTIEASLPFPIRINAQEYLLNVGSTEWRLLARVVRHEHPDQRLMGPGSTVDVVTDPDGKVSYSKVRGTAYSKNGFKDPVRSFLVALNTLINHVRDLFEVEWIRPVERIDLFEVVVETGADLVFSGGFGRTGGITMPATGLTDQANRRLTDALTGGDPPLWRQLELDAQHAMNRGLTEDAVVLAWTALESACRAALPGVAETASMALPNLENTVRTRGRRKRPSYSPEEAVNRGETLRIIQTMIELRPVGYHTGSLLSAVTGAYRARNAVVHRGLRLSKPDGDLALGGIRFLLRQLDLRAINPPDELKYWTKAYGQPSDVFIQFLKKRNRRIVPANPLSGGQTGSWFSLEQAGNELWVRANNTIDPRIIETSVAFELMSTERLVTHGRPRLRVTDGTKDLYVPVLLESSSAAVERSLAYGEVVLSEYASDFWPVLTAQFFLERLKTQVLETDNKMEKTDVRSIFLAAELAKYFVALPHEECEDVLDSIRDVQPSIATLVERWQPHYRKIAADNPESICETLLGIHSETLWLDSVVVDCPSRGKSYGTSERELGQPT